MRIPRSIAAAAVVGTIVGVPSAGAAAQHFITGKDVKNNSLTSSDVRNLSLHAKDFDTKVQAALKLRAQQGAAGATGASGAQGATGAAGNTGATGANGVAGATGAQGNQGVQGHDGLSAFVIWQQTHPGMTEDQFLTAIKGDTGKDGVQNVSDAPADACFKYGGYVITFSTGDTKLICNGKTGNQGEQGEQGERGLGGEKGDKGNDGKDGVNGVAGDHGLSAYEDWLLLNGYDRNDHSVGDFMKSLKGESIKGDNGADGAAGSNGSNGKDGASGRSAYQMWLLGEDETVGTDDDNHGSVGQFMSSLHGKDGAKGENGRDGVDGANGSQGIQGEHGKDGVNGKDGAPGQAGRDGIDGNNGVDGKDGAKGDKGEPGADGRDGAPGLQGPKGDDGKQGPKGDNTVAQLTVVPVTVDDNTAIADVDCPANMIATGGGGEAASGTNLVENAPRLNPQGKPTGWHIKDTSTGKKSRKVYVVCAPTS